MRGDGHHIPGYRVVIVTMDSHVAGPAARVSERLAQDFPGLSVSVHAAAEWGENAQALEEAKLARQTWRYYRLEPFVHGRAYPRHSARPASPPRHL